jgi:hypothetical protein
MAAKRSPPAMSASRSSTAISFVARERCTYRLCAAQE